MTCGAVTLVAMDPDGARPKATQWLGAFARELGVAAPSDEQVEALLALAGTAAHASERTAAPVACWLAALAGVSPADATLAAARVGTGTAGVP